MLWHVKPSATDDEAPKPEPIKTGGCCCCAKHRGTSDKSMNKPPCLLSDDEDRVTELRCDQAMGGGGTEVRRVGSSKAAEGTLRGRPEARVARSRWRWPGAGGGHAGLVMRAGARDGS